VHLNSPSGPASTVLHSSQKQCLCFGIVPFILLLYVQVFEQFTSSCLFISSFCLSSRLLFICFHFIHLVINLFVYQRTCWFIDPLLEGWGGGVNCVHFWHRFFKVPISLNSVVFNPCEYFPCIVPFFASCIIIIFDLTKRIHIYFW